MNRYQTERLPEPPGNFTEEARRTWYEAGLKLIKTRGLSDENLALLKDLCYWEEQKQLIMERIRAEQSADAGSAGKSVHLMNLRAIKQEMDQVRNTLGIVSETPATLENTPRIPDEAYQSLPEELGACCQTVSDPRKRDLLLLALVSTISGARLHTLTEHADGFNTLAINAFLIDNSGYASKLTAKVHQLAEGAGLRNAAQNNLITVQHPARDYEALRGNIAAAFKVQPQTGSGVDQEGAVCLTGDLELLRKIALNTAPEIIADFLVYSSGGNSKWQSHRPDQQSRTLNRALESLMIKVKKAGSMLSGRDQALLTDLTPQQWEMIDDTFAEKMEIIDQLGLPPALHTANNKAAIITVKLASLFAVMRTLETDVEKLKQADVITAAEDDVIAALWITDTSLKHSIRVFEELPGRSEPDRRGERFHQFYHILPVRFDTSEAMEFAGKMDIPARTSKRYLNKFIKEKKLVRLKRGRYEKVI